MAPLALVIVTLAPERSWFPSPLWRETADTWGAAPSGEAASLSFKLLAHLFVAFAMFDWLLNWSFICDCISVTRSLIKALAIVIISDLASDIKCLKSFCNSCDGDTCPSSWHGTGLWIVAPDAMAFSDHSLSSALFLFRSLCLILVNYHFDPPFTKSVFYFGWKLFLNSIWDWVRITGFTN